MLPETAGDYTIGEFTYGVQDTTAMACKIIVVTDPGYGVYTIYGKMHGETFWQN